MATRGGEGWHPRHSWRLFRYSRLPIIAGVVIAAVAKNDKPEGLFRFHAGTVHSGSVPGSYPQRAELGARARALPEGLEYPQQLPCAGTVRDRGLAFGPVPQRAEQPGAAVTGHEGGGVGAIDLLLHRAERQRAGQALAQFDERRQRLPGGERILQQDPDLSTGGRQPPERIDDLGAVKHSGIEV